MENQEPVTVKLPEGWLSQAEAQCLLDNARGKRVLELGAFKGRSTVVMALVAKLVVSVDWHKGDRHVKLPLSLPEYTENIKPYPNVVSIVARFEDAIPVLMANQFDMVYVDGQHDFQSVQRDMVYAMAFKPKVICVHDWGIFQVQPAIEAMGFKPTRVVETMAVFEQDWPEVKLVEVAKPQAEETFHVS